MVAIRLRGTMRAVVAQYLEYTAVQATPRTERTVNGCETGELNQEDPPVVSFAFLYFPVFSVWKMLRKRKFLRWKWRDVFEV